MVHTATKSLHTPTGPAPLAELFLRTDMLFTTGGYSQEVINALGGGLREPFTLQDMAASVDCADITMLTTDLDSILIEQPGGRRVPAFTIVRRAEKVYV